MLGPFRDFFATPARQALGWAALGIIGLIFAALGVMLILGGNDSSAVPASAVASSTATKTPTTVPSPSPSATASPTASPTPTEAPTIAPTATRAAATGGGGASNPTPVPPTPTPEPTPVAAVVTAGGPYCDAVTTTRPPTRIFGRLRFGGVGAPVGTTVTILFDGVTGRSEETKEPGGYKIDWAVAGSDCANRAGAAIAIMVNGTIYASSIRVGADAPFVQFDIDVP